MWGLGAGTAFFLATPLLPRYSHCLTVIPSSSPTPCQLFDVLTLYLQHLGRTPFLGAENLSSKNMGVLLVARNNDNTNIVPHCSTSTNAHDNGR